ncbi:hypothetical protein GGI00_000098, partial [Coemansia sp. RSA 2681]
MDAHESEKARLEFIKMKMDEIAEGRDEQTQETMRQVVENLAAASKMSKAKAQAQKAQANLETGLRKIDEFEMKEAELRAQLTGIAVLKKEQHRENNQLAKECAVETKRWEMEQNAAGLQANIKSTRELEMEQKIQALEADNTKLRDLTRRQSGGPGPKSYAQAASTGKGANADSTRRTSVPGAKPRIERMELTISESREARGIELPQWADATLKTQWMVVRLPRAESRREDELKQWFTWSAPKGVGCHYESRAAEVGMVYIRTEHWGETVVRLR